MTGPEMLALKQLIDKARRAQLSRNRGVDGALARMAVADRHGVSAYRQGCRCQVCRDARAAAERERNNRLKHSSAAGANAVVAAAPAAEMECTA